MEPYLLCSLVMVLLSRTVADGLMIGLLMSLDAMDGVMGLDGCIPGLDVVLPAVVWGLVEIPCFEPPFEPCIMLDDVPGLFIPTEDVLFAIVGLAVVLARDAVLCVPVAIFLVAVDGFALVLAVVVLAFDAVIFLAAIGFLAVTVFLTELLFAVRLIGLADLLRVLFALDATFFIELLLALEADFLVDVDLLMPVVALDAEAVLRDAVLLAGDAVLLADAVFLVVVVLGLDVPLPELLMLEPRVRAMDWPCCIA
ncbi:hypothetical protein [Legionella erythra]|nr:hypothetical protein [Legionella erythra]